MAKDPVWEHFEGDSIKARCKYCNDSYTSGKVERMKKHLERCTKIPASIKADLKTSSTLKRPIFVPEKSSAADRQLDRRSISSPPAKKQVTLQPFVDSMTEEQQKSCEELLIKSLVTGGVPLNFLKNDDFQAFLHALRPGFKVPDRNTSMKNTVANVDNEDSDGEYNLEEDEFDEGTDDDTDEVESEEGFCTSDNVCDYLSSSSEGEPDTEEIQNYERSDDVISLT